MVNSGFGAANHSMNFIIYVLSGSTFRREFILMLCGEKKKRYESNDTLNTVTTQMNTDIKYFSTE